MDSTSHQDIPRLPIGTERDRHQARVKAAEQQRLEAEAPQARPRRVWAERKPPSPFIYRSRSGGACPPVPSNFDRAWSRATHIYDVPPWAR